jgi:hypothetical protein
MDTLNRLHTDLIQQIVPYLPYKYIVEYDDFNYNNPVVLYYKDFTQSVSKVIVGGYDKDTIKMELKKFIDNYIVNVRWVSPRYEHIYGLGGDLDHLYDEDEYREFLCVILNFFSGYEDDWFGDFISSRNPWVDDYEEDDLPDEIEDFYDLTNYQRVGMLKFMLFSSCLIKNN